MMLMHCLKGRKGAQVPMLFLGMLDVWYDKGVDELITFNLNGQRYGLFVDPSGEDHTYLLYGKAGEGYARVLATEKPEDLIVWAEARAPMVRQTHRVGLPGWMCPLGWVGRGAGYHADIKYLNGRAATLSQWYHAIPCGSPWYIDHQLFLGNTLNHDPLEPRIPMRDTNVSDHWYTEGCYAAWEIWEKHV